MSPTGLTAVRMTLQSESLIIYSDKKEMSDFHGTVAVDPVKMLQQK